MCVIGGLFIGAIILHRCRSSAVHSEDAAAAGADGEADKGITVKTELAPETTGDHHDAAPLLYAPGDDGVLDLTEGTTSTLTRRGAAQRRDVDFV